MDFGRLLRELRERRGMTQFDLAERSGISQSTISALETGKQRPWPSTRRNLAAAVEMTLEEFDEVTSPAEPNGATAARPESSTGQSDTVLRLVKQVHRLEDRNATDAQDLEMLRRFVELAPIIMWTTDAQLQVTSLIGWGEGRRKRWSDAVGRHAGDSLLKAFDEAHALLIAHEEALAGASKSMQVNLGKLKGSIRIEPRKSASGDVTGVVAVAYCGLK